MAESVKRNQQNKNKIKKTKNDLIKSSLGVYLKGRNYTMTDKFRKSDKTLTQTPFEMALSILIDGEIARPNSFSYSNVFCLNNNPLQVDQQFSKFSTFIQSQCPSVKNELQSMLPPLLCHLYLEMLKGRDFRPAFDFLKKYASLVAPIDTINSTSAHKINGSTVPSLQTDDSSQQISNGNTQIIFLPEPEDTTLTNDNSNRESFKELIQILSTLTRIQDIESQPSVLTFRSCKFDIKLSQKAINILKNYLEKKGHVIVLQIIQVWFHIEIDGADKLLKSEFDDEDDDEEIDVKLESNEHNLSNYENVCAESSLNNIHLESFNNTDPEYVQEDHIDSDDVFNIIKEISYVDNFSKIIARDELMESYEKLENSTPHRVLNIKTNNNNLCTANIDSNECHVVAGFDNSIINLWTLKKSIYYGRKPFSCVSDRLCEWSLENCDYNEIEKYNSSYISSGSSSNNSSDDESLDDSIVTNRFRRRRTRRDKWKKFMESKCSQNSISRDGGIILRGHNSAVTDVLLSRHNPLLYSVSRDLTMRVWRADNYTCASVYRGHNYPLWCVAESSNGLYVATGSKDTTARLWSTDRKFPLIVYVGHTQDVDTIAFHPNGNYLATGSTDLSVRLWCVSTGKIFRVFTDCKQPVQTIAFSPDGKYLAAAGEESKIRIFDLAAGTQLTELKNVSAPVTSVSWNSHSTTFACCSIDGSYKVWNVSEMGVEKQSTKLSSDPVPSTSASSYNQINATASTSGSTSSTSSSLRSSTLLLSNTTNCKRLIKLQYNNDNSISFIGNS